MTRTIHKVRCQLHHTRRLIPDHRWHVSVVVCSVAEARLNDMSVTLRSR